MEILYSSLHNLNLNEDNPTRKKISMDFNIYLDSYIQFVMNENKTTREYVSLNEHGTVLRSIFSFFDAYICQVDEINNRECLDDIMNEVAIKLLDVEKNIQERIGHMTDVQKGSIVQALVKENDVYRYVIAKVEHSDWFDGDTLKKNNGFSGKNKKVWKSAVFSLENDNGKIHITRIMVYVDNSAKYWAKEFLEVREAKTNEYNTNAVWKAVERTLNPLKRKSLQDYYCLRNTVIHEIQSGCLINYPEMVEKLLDNYQPASSTVNVGDLKQRLLAFCEQEDFDTQFIPDTGVINRKLKLKIKVSPSIDIHVNDEVPDWKDNFLVHRKPDGRSFIMIRCDDNEILSAFPEDEN